jgi:hypothetical protein
MAIVQTYERRRLRRSGQPAEMFDPKPTERTPDALVFDVSTPSNIEYMRVLANLPGPHRALDVVEAFHALLMDADPKVPKGGGGLVSSTAY